MFKASVQRIAQHFGQDPKRAMDRLPARNGADFARQIAQREAELAASSGGTAWGELMEQVLSRPPSPFDAEAGDERMDVPINTRWG